MLIHASCVALDGRAVLIRGAAGSGKSGLALQLMALGAALVADDRTEITLHDGWPVAACPAAIRGRIEARGLGLLAADPAPPAVVRLVVDLDRVETDRLPPERHTDLLGVPLPLFHKVESLHFAPAILQYLRAGPAMM
ncbi:HPr kinase/phosphatase C-terminal domain-containing protein [Psychromarinibacter sp. C21-152]|uniref:HPr kinase/phosphatase C-terminal domain-containing protein n=1 Tax=Psychromarinibacter sediminicola TaxID=3033385 RepID=A0AAE3NSG6_9RHOB|nr:HPr kinase/phosphatase C-terminal domain-containing protein [Psychromarinibacter sediminicola]MDF0600809.1 HPr kinase/phosphatase C-terminal domain-containing protein [Psychromarinibacter sediminicola]